MIKVKIFNLFRHFCLAISLSMSVAIPAQLIDNFSDGNFTDNPAWDGSTADFIINGDGELQLNSAIAGQSYLSASLSATDLDNKEWSFWISQTFAASDNNHSRFYLSSSSTVLSYSGINGSAGVQGYFLRFGEGGSNDAVRLFRDDASGNPILLASSPDGGISASFAVSIKVTRSAAGEWNLFLDPNGGNAFGLVASVIDDTYTSSNALGWVCTYTITNADKFFLDNVYFDSIIEDNEPPVVLSVNATSSNTLDILFSEPVSEASCSVLTNYFITGQGNPVTAVRNNLNYALVHLGFSSDFVANTTNTIVISGVTDESDNVMSSGEEEFIWFVPGVPEFRSVVFNEILADPTPVVGLPEGEFIEIFNAGDEAFDLNGWQLVNSTTPKELPAYLLEPGSFVVLCDASLASAFNPSIGIASFTALTNDTDSLTLLDNLGNVIDILVYNSDWYASPEKGDGGWSLEQINPFYPCQNSNNWMESSNDTGGSPGIQNSVFNDSPDILAPEVDTYSLADETHIVLGFSEPIDAGSADVLNWSVIPFNSVESFSWNSDFTALNIQLQQPVIAGQTTTLIIIGFADCSGNVSGEIQLDFTLGSVPQSGDLIITEIMADPDPSIGAPPAEYLEVYNRSEQLLDLNGVTINDNAIESQVLLEPGSYIILGDDGDALAFLSVPNRHLMSSFPALTNSGMTIEMRGPDMNILDVVSYDISWYQDNSKADGGWSLERINLDDPCSDASNWIASESASGGTPGAVNSVNDPAPDVTPPVFQYLIMEPQESLTLVFSEPLSDDFTQVDWFINGEPVSNPQIELNYDIPNQLVIYVGELEEGIIYTWEIIGVSDCWSNTSASVSGIFAIAQEPAPGDLLVNEILFDPLDGGSDFVEIYNHSDKTISLSGWMTGNDDPADNELITALNLPLFPGEYLVITENGTDLPEFYPFTRTDRILRVENLPTYSVTGGEVALILPDGTTSDRMSYSEDMHYPLLNSTDGVSLERISPSRPSDDVTNWHSAAQSQSFATPGYLNSQSQLVGFDPDQLVISPEIFSPDNDGYQDVVTISYVNDSPGWVANVTIFDSEGRERRKLISNELLGTSGTISWDGFSDDRILCPIGRYVIYFEVFSASGDVRSIKKTCVLAQKLN